MKGIMGKVALITGATSGIGKAIALRFAQEGAKVAINYRKDKKEAETVLAEVNSASQAAGYAPHNIIVQADVSNSDEVQSAFERLEELGGVDILVNNAGIQMEGDSHEIELSKFDKMLDVNLRGAYLCSRYAIQQFLKRSKQGVVLNNSSVHEIIPRPGYIGYTISKGGMEAMTRTLALEYARRGIRINSIAPGATLTPINDWADDPEEKQKIEEFIPMGRAGEPEEMAAAAVFLASDEAAYITGQTLFIDGGLTLYPGFREPIT